MQSLGPRGSLVEREQEVDALRGVFAGLAGGSGGVVVVDGAAGLGKTALLRRARELAREAGLTVLSARGAELERDFAFGVVRQLVEPALPRDAEDRAALFTGSAAATRGLFDADEPGDDTAVYAVLNGLYWLLVTMSERGPLVVMVDDAQWADLPSLRFLGFLARRVESVAISVVAATRAAEHEDGGLLDDILAADDCVLIEPRNLSEAAVADLVRRELGQAATDEFCAACHRITTGNPLFVRELLRVLAGGDVRLDADAALSAGPVAIRRYVAARLRRQPEDVRRVVTAVAVLGDDTDLPLVAHQAGVPPEVAAAAAERLAQHGIFERAQPPAFVHAVVRDVALSLVSLAERDAEHDRAASVLQAAGEPLARVASHLLRTTPAGNVDRLPVLLGAAQQAWLQGSPESASAYLGRARAEPPPPEARSEVSRRLGNCEAHQLALANAGVHLNEALSLADEPAQRARCAYSLARFRNACGETGPALALLSQAVAELPEQADPEVVGELIGFARADVSNRSAFLDVLARLRARVGDTDPLVAAQLSLESVLAGSARRGVELARTALAGDRLPPERTGFWPAVTTLMFTDHLTEAEGRVQRALAHAVDRGQLLPQGFIRAYLARISLLRGDLAQAEEHVELGTRAVPEPNIGLPLLASTRTHLLVEQGRVEEAAEILRDVAEIREPRTALHLWLLGARTRVHAARGDHEAALADALACGSAYERWGATGVWEVPWRLSAADAYLGLGQRPRAAELVAEQLRRARSFGVASHIGVALRSFARLGDPVPSLKEAVELLRTSPARLELARALADLGHQQPRSRETLRQAAVLALECRATALAERLQGTLTARGGRAPRIQVSGVPALTPSERQVAALAADALTNRQIAERLYVTEKTVETHLSRAYRKLGVTSRTQLAVQMTTSR